MALINEYLNKDMHTLCQRFDINFIQIYLLNSYIRMIKAGSKNEPRNYFRSTSAKARSARSNLNSSWANKNNVTQVMPPSEHNKDQVANVINGFKLHQLVGMNNEEMGKFKRNSAKFTNKSIQQLYEENLHLKRNNNRLLEEVAQLKGRFEAKARTNSERGKQLDLQFQKQLYWGGSKTHLISGIKHQYQKLQKAYSEQSKQLNELKKALLQTKYPQCQVHAEVLEIQNKKLSQKLKKIMQNSMKTASNTGSNKRATQVLLAQIEDKLSKSQKNLKTLRSQLQACQQQVKQKQKKTLFLQKLLIEKDNSQYHAHRKIKKLQKIINDLKIINDQLKQHHIDLENNHKIEIENLQKMNQRQKENVREESKKQNQELKNKIQFLLEDKKQLQTNINKLKMTNSMIGGGGSSIRIAAGDRKSHISPNKDISKNQSFNSQHNKTNNKLGEIPNEETFNGYESQIESNTSKKEGKNRVMLTADKKHSIHSKKMRKVHHSQVAEIGQLIKYRMIASNLSIQQMKKFFDRNKNILDVSDDWEEEYLNMKQLVDILKSAPFKLEQDMAYNLSRYLIEDCNEEYVYCDEKNENKREIVKSIMKTLIGQYILIDETVQEQIAQFKSKYLSNLQSALKTYYPNGKVPKKKFVEVLMSMGTEMKEKSIEAIVAKLVDKSSNLSELLYEALESL